MLNFFKRIVLRIFGTVLNNWKTYGCKKKTARGVSEEGYYHLSTDGRPDVLLFRTKEEYAMGMTAIALVAIRFKVQIYVFELMPNHIHIVLSATGNTCVEIFEFIVRRISRQLKSDGYPPLPEDYDFRLTDIEDPKSFLDHYIYAARNPFEKGWCVPGGYLFSGARTICCSAGGGIL